MIWAIAKSVLEMQNMTCEFVDSADKSIMATMPNVCMAVATATELC